MNVKQYREKMQANVVPEFEQRSRTGGPPNKEQNWVAALDQLEDKNAPLEPRLAALRFLQAGSFDVTAFANFLARYIAVLQRLSADASVDTQMRRAALNILTNRRDEVAREVLIKGLSEPSGAAVPPAVALGMLARDDHGSAAPVARQILESDAEPHVREQAIRVLGADPSARPLLEGILKDRDEDRTVRQAGAIALRSLSPEAFEAVSKSILSDPTEFSEIKLTLERGLSRHAGRTVKE